MIHYYLFVSCVCKRYLIIIHLFEAVGKAIHDFCEHTDAHQWEFPSTTKLKLQQCKAFSERVKNIFKPIGL